MKGLARFLYSTPLHRLLLAGGAPAAPKALPAVQGGSAVSFEGVSFHYPSRPTQAALKDFTLQVQPGETVAVVG
ncbi:MAG: hypothetical protein ACO3EK_17985, partial [Alphaproteobacteria bacterium]